jgi:hypothetical protein
MWVTLCYGFLHIDALRAKAVRAWCFTPVTFDDDDVNNDPLISLPFRTRIFNRLAFHGRWSTGTKLVYAFVRPTKQHRVELDEIARGFAKAFATLAPLHITRRNHITRRLIGTIAAFALSIALASVIGVVTTINQFHAPRDETVSVCISHPTHAFDRILVTRGTRPR